MEEDNLPIPDNSVDDVVITQDRFGRDVTISVDENGNIILYRATDDPNRIIDSDFRPLEKDKGSVGLGQQSYFSPNPMYSHKYQLSGRKNYKFVTQIKPNEILPTDMLVKNYPELVNALNIPEEFTNQNWRQLVNDDKAMIAMGYETGGKRFFNDNIQTFIDNDIKAFGSGSTGTGGQTYIEYEIIPLVKENDTLGIKPIATLQTKEGFAAGKSPEAFIETPLDTPTNVVDDVPTLNTDLVWEKEKIDVDTNPQWKDDVIPKNNIFNPTMEYEELSDIVPRILDGTASDVEFARFGIYLLHNSPQPAFGPRGMSDPDMIADVVKIVIFNGKTFQYAINPKIIDNVYGRAELKSGGLPNELTKEVMLQFANEEGVFANAKQRIKQTIINEHNKLYANADDYFILFRSGNLTNDPIQSFSKSGRQAYLIGFLTGQETSRKGGRGVDAYFVNKNDFIDLQALGLDYGSEAEVIVFKQAVDNPYSKAVIPPGEDFNYLSKERVEFLKNNWVMMQDEFPKTGFINSIKPDDPTRNQTLRVMDDTPDATTASTRVQQVAFDFAKTNGLAEPNFNAIAYFNPEVGLEAADIYEGLPDFDDSAVPLYNKFIKETNAQYDALTNAGIQFELVDTDPYTPNAAGHKQMINDMQNGRLKVLATSSAGELPEGSPMGKVSKYTDVNGRQMLENDVFRAVHDTFGHGMRGNTFGPIGEYNAWLAHKEMYTPTSQRVMTTETLGQNTYVNFGPHMRTEEGALIGKGDSGYIKPQDRPFAPQKVAVMPDTIITKAGDVVTDATGLVNTNAMTKVRNFISNTPDAAESLWKATKFTLGKGFRGLQVLDPGDIAIEYGLARLLPRLGLGAIAAPALYAYVFYELAVLAVDAANGLQKAAEKQGIAGIGEDKDIDWKQLGKDTWSEMGEVSDDWSLSWKISEPIINSVFEEYGKMKAAKEEKDYFSNLETGLAPR